MYIMLEMAIGVYIFVKMYCIYDDQLNFNLKSLGAFAGMLISCGSIIISLIKSVFILFK